MQLDTIFIAQVAVPVGCLFLGGWQFIRANRYRQRLADAQARHRDELAQDDQHLAKLLLSETGTLTVLEFIDKWRQLNYRLGYALHHIEEFEATPLLKRHLVTIASQLRMRARQSASYQAVVFWDYSAPTGGFREVTEDEEQSEWEMRLLVDGLDNWQLAGICCYIMDGYYLEAAFYKVGISVYSPTGKAMAIGEQDLNPYGYRLDPLNTNAATRPDQY